MPAARRRAFIRIDNGTRRGCGSLVSELSETTKALCAQLFADGLIELATLPDGTRWYRTTPHGRRLRDESETEER